MIAMENNAQLQPMPVSVDTVIQEFSKVDSETIATGKLSYADILKEVSEELRKRKAETISFSEPLVKLNDTGIIFPGTINVIQGQSGAHKSRVAGMFAGIFLRKNADAVLGFSRCTELTTTVCYIDTERNTKDQLPYALQCIQISAGYALEEDPPNYIFTSLLKIRREERFVALDEHLNCLRGETQEHIFIILDVITDCITDFNKTDESMRMIDMLNMMINRYNVTFLCVIHENPGQQKARGHLGTELFNKATTVLQLQLEYEGDGIQSDIIRIRFLKCRNSKCPSPVFARFDSETQSLVKAEVDAIKSLKEKRIRKASESDVLDCLKGLTIGHSYSQKEIVQMLVDRFDISDKTAIVRLKSISEGGILFLNNGNNCFLKCTTKGKAIYTVQRKDTDE